MPNDPASSAACEASASVAGLVVECELESPHEHEHEALLEIEVLDTADSGTLTPFLVWWGDDGHAFVGSNKAVDTGRIG